MRRLPWLVLPAVALWLSNVVLDEVLRLDPVGRETSTAPPRRATPPAPLDPGRVQALLGLRPVPVRPAAGPAERPRFRLRGTLVSRAGRSLAMVDSSTGRTRTLGPGDELEGWVIEAVAWGRVVVVRDGERVEVGTGRPSGPESAPARGPASRVPTLTLRRGELPALFAAHRDEVLKRTHALPVYDGARFTGLRLSFPAGSPLERLGLRPGDLVVSTDGQAITPERLAELSLHWAALRSLEVGVRRDGRDETLLWTLE